jgi:hypothetical protein
LSVRKCHLGVLQGSVLSPHLFNFFVSDFPNDVLVNDSFADDFYLCAPSSDIYSLGPLLTSHLSHSLQWAKEKKLSIAPSKSTVTLSTSNKTRGEPNYHPKVYYEGVLLPLEKHPTSLGVTSSIHGTSAKHTSGKYGQDCRRLQLLKVTSEQD